MPLKPGTLAALLALIEVSCVPITAPDRAASHPPSRQPPTGQPPAGPPPPYIPPPNVPPARKTTGIWISKQEIAALPMSGPAWAQLKATADQPAGMPLVSNQDQMNNVYVLAKALVYARTGIESYRTDVRANCIMAIDTELGGRTLALARELAAYVIAADLAGLSADEEARFRPWLQRCLTETLDGMSLRSTQERRPNNWGTHASASRAAVAAYLGDVQELQRTAQVFRGYLGDRNAYTGFVFGDLAWQADEAHPVGILPRGATKLGWSLDGALPDDMRRGCVIQSPPCPTNYPWEALQGAVVAAEILYRQGFDTWNWSDQALRRAVVFLWNLDHDYPGNGWWASGDDEWQLWILNRTYGTRYAAASPAHPGKNMGWTDWTHNPATRPLR